MVVQNHASSEIMISSSYMTKMHNAWKMHNAENEQTCAHWFAPVVDRFGRISDINIYCLLCNGKIYHPGYLCSEVRPDR